MQPREVVNSLRGGKAYRCDPARSEWGGDFAGAYDWIAQRMAAVLGPGPNGALWPVWAWARMSGRDSPTPRFSWNMVPLDFHLGGRTSWPNSEARGLFWLVLDVDPARVLLSDFGLWHSVLNGTYCVPRDQWEDEGVWDRVWTQTEIEASWQHAFTIAPDCPDVQACLWEIRPEDVTATCWWWSPRTTRYGSHVRQPRSTEQRVRSAPMRRDDGGCFERVELASEGCR